MPTQAPGYVIKVISRSGATAGEALGRHGTKRVAKVVLIGSVTPSLLKTPENPDGTPIEVFDGFRQAVIANRAQFMKDLAIIYFGAERPGALEILPLLVTVSRVRLSFY